ncbi:MAG TPA: sigma factor [Alphaproteobacteria bacterium]|nr:sigma factor [Alphaproteobacteria bacterium]
MTIDPIFEARLGPWRLEAAQLSAHLAGCARGESKAMEGLYGALAAAIHGRLVRMLRNVTLAEDVLQETFVAVWRNAHRFDPLIGIPAAWIWVIARNRAVTALQR